MSDKSHMKRVSLYLSVVCLALSFYTLYAAKVCEIRVQSLANRVENVEGVVGVVTRRGASVADARGDRPIPGVPNGDRPDGPPARGERQDRGNR